VAQFQNVLMNCDAIAPYYSVLEHLSFGSSLEKSRCAFLGEAATSLRAIVCGGGDGRFLAHLLQANSYLNVDFVDMSPKMVELAERRVLGMGQSFRKRVKFHTCDIRNFWARPGSYDLIATHFFLDCFSQTELPSVVSRIANWGRPNGLWMVSEFREAQGPVSRVWTHAVIRFLYAAFRFMTGLRVTRLPNYVAALEGAGYSLFSEKKILGGLLHSSLWRV
jgi:ubiquinone/menaquinone biosynthesis C-methylase UbiE